MLPLIQKVGKLGSYHGGFMYNENYWEWEERSPECAQCEARALSEYHTQDHLKGLQLAMMNGHVEDIAFHLQEICSANNAEFIYGVKDE